MRPIAARPSTSECPKRSSLAIDERVREGGSTRERLF
jgi:hypothetical protein